MMPQTIQAQHMQDIESRGNNAMKSEIKLGDINFKEEDSVQMDDIEKEMQIEMQNGKFQ